MILRRVLIANRGEIALRVIRTCQRLGIETVLAASEADLHSVAAREADRAICIGPPESGASYLSIPRLIAAATESKAQAVHPGYGFLSENSSFAAACERAGLTFIGPAAAQLAAVGDKLKAREHANAAGLPCVVGGEVDSLPEAEALAQQIGWPILVKAVGGGGGRGLKLVKQRVDLPQTLALAMAEARAAFGDSRVYLERFIPHGRHVEVQVLGDGENVLHLGTRDCSIQRRYQKLLEEAPAPSLSESLVERMQDAAVAFASHLRYRSAGTVEFLIDCDQNSFYFLEMNARIQVEHPVTESVCGVDLVAEQIAIAEGQPLRLRQNEIRLAGHAIECRINAEDWTHDFFPSPGRVSRASFPVGPGIRVDTHIQSGTEVPPYYDSLLAKVIVHAATRAEALEKMRRALARVEISGIATNVGLHLALLQEEGCCRGGVPTTFLRDFLQTHAVLTVP